MRRLLLFSAVVEMITGMALMIAPTLVAAMLVRGEVTELAIVLGRSMGATLLALGLACWPGRETAAADATAFRGMFTYNGLIALLLGYAGAVANLAGPLLWPAVALHGTVALLLVWKRRDKRPFR